MVDGRIVDPRLRSSWWPPARHEATRFGDHRQRPIQLGEEHMNCELRRQNGVLGSDPEQLTQGGCTCLTGSPTVLIDYQRRVHAVGSRCS